MMERGAEVEEGKARGAGVEGERVWEGSRGRGGRGEGSRGGGVEEGEGSRAWGGERGEDSGR